MSQGHLSPYVVIFVTFLIIATISVTHLQFFCKKCDSIVLKGFNDGFKLYEYVNTIRRKLVEDDIDLEADLSRGPAKKRSRRPSQILDANETDISRPSILRCDNQTRCIRPKLQLQRAYNVYFCKHVAYGIRFYYLIREGLLLHPLINLVDSPDNAEVIVYLPVSSEWDKSECKNPKYRSKTIVLDEGDYPQLFDPPKFDASEEWAMYFKRSCKFLIDVVGSMPTCEGRITTRISYCPSFDILPYSLYPRCKTCDYF